MALDNRLTDQLDLVKQEEGKGILRLFSRNMSLADGFCLVVFRKENYLGSIISDEVITENDLKRRCERLGVRDGDVVLRINMGPRPLTIREKLSTQDGYVRAYQLDIEIRVNDPRAFAQRYRQLSDPVNMARVAIEGFLQRYANRKPHDELREDMLRDYSEQALVEGSNRSFGLAVTSAHKVTLWMDPLRVRELEIQQKGHLEEQAIREKMRLKQIETLEGTNVRKVEVQGEAEVNILQLQFNQQIQSSSAAYARIEEERQKQHEIELETYLAQKKARLHEVTRIDEIDEKAHQLKLTEKQDDYLRLEAGKDSAFKRKEEGVENAHIAEQRKLTRVTQSDEQKHQIEMKAISQAAQRREDLLDTVGAKAIESLSDVIGDQISSRQKLSEVFSEYPELEDIFHSQKREQRASTKEVLQIEDTKEPEQPSAQKEQEQPPAQKEPEQPLASNDRPASVHTNFPNTGVLPGILREQNYTIDITDLGMTLLQIQLSESQQEIAFTSTPTAFVVSALSPTGLARRAQLATGDIIVEMNGQELSSSQAISHILEKYKPGAQVSLCYLRGEELIDAQLKSLEDPPETA